MVLNKIIHLYTDLESHLKIEERKKLQNSILIYFKSTALHYYIAGQLQICIYMGYGQGSKDKVFVVENY